MDRFSVGLMLLLSFGVGFRDLSSGEAPLNMLRELLALIAAGHSGTSESIARELGLRAPEIDDMLARLLSLGYIEDMAASCASCCAG